MHGFCLSCLAFLQDACFLDVGLRSNFVSKIRNILLSDCAIDDSAKKGVLACFEHSWRDPLSTVKLSYKMLKSLEKGTTYHMKF